VDPVAQRLVVVTQAYANGLISYEQHFQMDTLNDHCAQAIAVGDMPTANVACEAMYDFVDVAAGGGLNMYDLRNFEPFSSAQIQNYLNNPEAKEALNLPANSVCRATPLLDLLTCYPNKCITRHLSDVAML